MLNINMKISSFLKILHLAVAQQGSGHAEKLSFPHGEVLSILCHLCLQWMRQLADLRPVTDRIEEKCSEYNTARLFNHHFSLTISLMCVFSRASQIWESEYWSQGSKLDLWEHKKEPNWIKHDDNITFMGTADATFLRLSWKRSTLTLARGWWFSEQILLMFLFVNTAEIQLLKQPVSFFC